MHHQEPDEISIREAARHAYALKILAQETQQSLPRIARLPMSTLLRDDLGMTSASEQRITARLQHDFGPPPGAPAFSLRTIADLYRW